MKTIKLLLFFAVILLWDCNIELYLEQVCKVRGKTLDWFTGEPIVSAEVFVQDSQYSELTNNEGDYEIELLEGTWQLTFRKENYLDDVKIVTLTADNPRIEGLETRMKPVLDELPMPEGISDYFVLEGVLYGVTRGSTGTTVIVKYDISDWYEITLLETGEEYIDPPGGNPWISLTYDGSDTIWLSSQTLQDTLEFLKVGFSDLEELDRYSFDENVRDNTPIRYKDGYLLVAFCPSSTGKIQLRTYDVSSGDPVFTTFIDIATSTNYNVSVDGMEFEEDILTMQIWGFFDGAWKYIYPQMDVSDPSSPELL